MFFRPLAEGTLPIEQIVGITMCTLNTGTLNPWCMNTIVCIDPRSVSLVNHTFSVPPWYNRIGPSKLPDMVDSSWVTWLCFATLKKHQREPRKTHTRGLANRVQQNNQPRPTYPLPKCIGDASPKSPTFPNNRGYYTDHCQHVRRELAVIDIVPLFAPRVATRRPRSFCT
jgi:hypothetical protein